MIPHPFLGKKRPEFAKKISAIMMGRKRPPEVREKMRIANLGKKYSKEVNMKKASKANANGRWNGGKTNYCKRQCIIRDDYTCQICGLRDPEIIEVDHIKPKCDYPELVNVLENLIALCPNCHRRRTNKFLRERYTKHVQ